MELDTLQSKKKNCSYSVSTQMPFQLINQISNRNCSSIELRLAPSANIFNAIRI